MHISDTPKERARLLRLLAARPAQLTLPLGNPALKAMLDEGLVAITGRWRQEMATRCYDCVKITLTEKGLEALPN